MSFHKLVTVIFFAVSVGMISCTAKPGTGASVETRLRAGAGSTATRMFDRRQLVVSGFHNLNDFIRPDVREHLDQEPTGGDDSFSSDLQPVDTQAADSAQEDTKDAEPEENAAYSEENPLSNQEVDKIRFLWAKKKFGDELNADPNLNGVIILYADENLYDIARMQEFVEEGRYRLATGSDIDPARIQVVFGGYRGTAQVELWLVPVGENMPELKPAQRNPAKQSEE